MQSRSNSPFIVAFVTQDGMQTVIPGAERIGLGELAQRKSDAPLRPAKPQRPVDFGLFGDERNQLDLLG